MSSNKWYIIENGVKIDFRFYHGTCVENKKLNGLKKTLARK